ncbi:hypothetical protein RGQ15_08895 [Paracoccus sp. MBLB3053]|uniref:Type I secretion protein n=1 Tax=Paracoccus aurantius TaxID=3073814 RepID=A0ABU2HRN7_9RHOB|nr:hypothetical protein [Paracoccus sp. MBLB3053]MDS9467686.1 hypothetical protein [Paracoccus sp. MBLB3053]
MTDEVSRLRIDYQEFDPRQTRYDTGEISSQDSDPKYPFELPDSDPGLAYRSQGRSMGEVHQDADYVFLDPGRGPLPRASYSTGPRGNEAETGPNDQGLFAPSVDFTPEVTPVVPVSNPGVPLLGGQPGPWDWDWTLPPPGSVATYIVQQSILHDGDLLLPAPGVLPPEFDGKLGDLYVQASQLGVTLDLALPQNEDAFLEMARAFARSHPPENQPDGAEVSTFQGAAVKGQILNGQAVEVAPQLEKLLPAYRAEILADEGHDNAAQHELVVGNNMLLNEAHINTAWIAAPVLYASQGIYSYGVVSQVNVWSDIDHIAGPNPVQAATNAVNYASFSSLSNPAPHLVAGAGDAPQYWVTATLEGSLVSFNWIDQYNLISDDDITSVTFHANETLMLIGENGALNSVSLAELGYQFDLIIIDGYIINLNSIQQTNILLDDDNIVLQAKSGEISSSDNLLMNSATITTIGETSFAGTNAGIASVIDSSPDGQFVLPPEVLADPNFAGLQVVRVLHIQGDLVSVNVIRQTNVLGDSDQVDAMAADLLDSDGDIRVVAGSNVLANTASITEYGVDATLYSSGEYYTDALLHQAELVSEPLNLTTEGAPVLASEAVLFLAEGMIGDHDADRTTPVHHDDAAVPSDIMETVLA